MKRRAIFRSEHNPSCLHPPSHTQRAPNSHSDRAQHSFRGVGERASTPRFGGRRLRHNTDLPQRPWSDFGCPRFLTDVYQVSFSNFGGLNVEYRISVILANSNLEFGVKFYKEIVLCLDVVRFNYIKFAFFRLVQIL